MKRRLVLHIGLSKTGTTSIQKALSRNRALLASQGILYPDLTGMASKDPRLASSVLKPDGRREPSHIALGMELRNLPSDVPARNIDTPLWSAVFRQISKNAIDTTVISYENFYWQPELYSFDLLTDRLKDFDVHGVMYLRPLEEWAISLYAQRVTGIKRTGSDFSVWASTPIASSRFSRIIDSVWKNIPFDSLSIGDFRLAASQGLIRDFLRRSGIVEGVIDDEADERSNVTLPDWATLFLLRCNRSRLPDEAFMDARKNLGRLVRRGAAPCLDPGLGLAAPDDRMQLQAIAAADANRLWRRHGVRLGETARPPAAYRPFSNEDFVSINETIGSSLLPTTRAALRYV